MFVYCLNNPVMGYDPTGEWTYSIGWSFSAFLGGGATYSISIAFDSSGNIALQTTKADVFKKNSGGTFGLASIGISKSYSYTNLETVDDLEGKGGSVGGSASKGIFSFGGEAIFSPSDTTEIVGASVSTGIGAGVDGHLLISKTETRAKINMVDMVKNVWPTIIGWFKGGRS